MTIDEITKLREVLARYDRVNLKMDNELASLSEEAEERGDYRYYDEARFDWLERVEDYAGFLADEIREVLKAYE